MKIQFILKKNDCYGFLTYTRRSSGLFNSTNFISDALKSRGFDTDVVEVVDNNDIDREVTRFKPDVVVIEALWVVPSKFVVLQALHPSVVWCVHLHSHMPFLAYEGIAMEWLEEYSRLGVRLLANSKTSYNALTCIFDPSEIALLPNIYPSRPLKHTKERSDVVLDVGCFGAIRPLKNQLLQALAAIKYCKDNGFNLRFHINASRVETNGEPILKNIRELFKSEEQTLVECHWMEPEEFRAYLASTIDVSLQVSLTETFNVVSADAINSGVPIVVSKEVPWAMNQSMAADDDVNSITSAINGALSYPFYISINRWFLKRYSNKALNAWVDYFSSY